jgi:tRNA threonylcarbamoyladenosine biosynthesis protein TsaB
LPDKIILAVDTSTVIATYAIAKNHHLLASVSSQRSRPHSQTFFGSLRQLLTQTQLTLAQIDLFAAVSGPGSFTGLRVGLSAIKGVAQSVGRPVFGVNAIDLTALSASSPGKFIVVLEAGRNEVFVGKRIVSTSLHVEQHEPDWVGRVESLPTYFQPESPEAILIGSGICRLQIGLAKQLAREECSLAVTLAIQAEVLQGHSHSSEMHAYYLRPSDAEVKFAKSILQH